MHDLRHFAGAQLIAAGVDVKTVQTRLGHSRPSTTLNVYTHAVSQNDEQAAAVIGSLVAARRRASLPSPSVDQLPSTRNQRHRRDGSRRVAAVDRPWRNSCELRRLRDRQRVRLLAHVGRSRRRRAAAPPPVSLSVVDDPVDELPVEHWMPSATVVLWVSMSISSRDLRICEREPSGSGRLYQGPKHPARRLPRAERRRARHAAGGAIESHHRAGPAAEAERLHAAESVAKGRTAGESPGLRATTPWQPTRQHHPTEPTPTRTPATAPTGPQALAPRVPRHPHDHFHPAATLTISS